MDALERKGDSNEIGCDSQFADDLWTLLLICLISEDQSGFLLILGIP